MPAVVSPLSVAQVDAFRDGDEAVFEQLVRTRYDPLVDKAGARLGADEIAAPRVVIAVFMDAWTDREQFLTPDAIDAYLDEAVPHRVADEMRRRASLHRFEKHEGVHVAPPAAKTDMTAGDAWDEIEKRLHVSAEELAEHREESRKLARRHAHEHVASVSSRRVPVGMLVMGAILLVVAVFGLRWMDQGSAELALTQALASEDARVLQSSPGQRGSITLLDESSAQLGAGSMMRIPRGFGTSVRGLQLEGAAHFVVAQGQELPFEVRARNSAIIVTGTDFSIRAYDDEPEVLVTVREGSVRVHPLVGDNTSHVIEAGDAVAVALDGTIRTPTAQELLLYFSWVDGEIVLENVTVDRALAKLKRWHNLDAQLDDPLLGERVVNTRLTLESAGQALDALTRAAGLRVDYEGEQMVLRDTSATSGSAPSVK